MGERGGPPSATAVGDTGGPPAACADALSAARSRTPRETLDRLRPHLPDLGITRVGLATGLDDVGIPVGFAVRPAGRALSVHQGKGLTDEAAMASAAMEAAEVALSERVRPLAVVATPAAAAAAGARLLDLGRLTRTTLRRPPPDRPVPLLAGRCLVTGEARSVPLPLVDMDHTDLSPDDPFDRSSDGLASGNTAEEAILHGLLELVERDATALARAWATGRLARARRAVAWFASPPLEDVAARLAAAGVDLALLDVSSDIGPWTIAAIVAPRGAARRPDLAAGDVCGGFAADPDAGTAALRAALEAVQARTTAVSGARDDIGAAWYRPVDAGEGGVAGLLDLLAAPSVGAPPPEPAAPAPARRRIDDLLRRLAGRGFGEVVAVDVPAPPGIHVVRMLVPGLEIGAGARGRRVGPRLLSAMLGAR